MWILHGPYGYLCGFRMDRIDIYVDLKCTRMDFTEFFAFLSVDSIVLNLLDSSDFCDL